MRIHLLIDWENRPPTAAEIERVRGARFRLWIAHGPQQGMFSAEHVNAWQPLGKQVRFVRSAKAGKNALDLHIAFCVGEASANDRHRELKSCFIIVSHDKGFDSLMGYLDSRDIRVRRADSLTEALSIAVQIAGEEKAAEPAKSEVKDDTKRVIENLRATDANKRPTTMKRLSNHIATFLAIKPTDPDVARVLGELTRAKLLKQNGTKPEYNL